VDNVLSIYGVEDMNLLEDEVFMDMLRSYHEQAEPDETSVAGTA